MISRKVAEKLGYEWKFVKLTHGIISTDYHSELHDSYFSFSNTFSSVPVEHEFTAVRLLKESGWIPDDSIFVNGMSGDFLTGSHIPKTLQGDRDDLNKKERKDLILSALINKHYSLWTHLKTSKNNKLVADNLWNEIVKEVNGLPENSIDDLNSYFEMIKENQFDAIFGSRFIRGGKTVDYPIIKLLLNRFGNYLTKILFLSDYDDFTNSFKIYKRNVVNHFYPIVSEDFNIFLELPLKTISRGFKYKIVPIKYYNRTIGEAKFKIKELGSRYMFTLLYCFLEKVLLKKKNKF